MEEKQIKRQRAYKVIMLLILAIFMTFMVTSVIMYNYFNENNLKIKLNNHIVKESPDLNDIGLTFSNKIKEINKVLERSYLGEIKENELVEGAFTGYVDALDDKYTTYISAEDMEEYTSDINGKFVGIGIYMTSDTEKDKILVLTPIKYSPAEEAGILPGDYITKVDGVEYTADDLNKIETKIKGEENTKVKLEILRKEETFEVEVTRKTITVNPIETKVLENNTGYMQITSFDDGTADEFEVKYKELKDKNIKSLVIDLRNNGGGLVKEALQILNYIVPKKSTILITVDKNNNEDITKSNKEPIVDIPIVVLVNENTASASEILSGTLKDLNVGTVVGTKTFGKGVIQQVITLSDGSGLTLTIEEYFTANKNKIDGVGIEPNVVVELPETVENSYLVTEEDDTQLKKAIEILK